MKIRKFMCVTVLSLVVGMTALTGCTNTTKMYGKELNSKLSGLSVSIRTYDENSNNLDYIHGESVSVSRDTKFDSQNTEGESNKDSSVINISIGSDEISHVGSSLIMAEESLVDIYKEYNQTVNVENEDTSIPIINRVVNRFKNLTTGKDRTLLIRSQSGVPLATYVGNNVSIFACDIPKTTVFLVDNQVLLVYRCDYTIYDTALLTE